MPSAEVTLTPGKIITVNPQWLTQKRGEIEEGEKAVEELAKIPGITKTRIARAKARLAFLKRYYSLLEDGFIPIPTMDYEIMEGNWFNHGKRRYTIYLDRMPVQALKNIAQFKHKFDEIGLVRPRPKRRDPILIGIIRHGQMEEHFILYFWGLNFTPTRNFGRSQR